MGVECMIMLIANCDMCRVTFGWNVRWLTCLCRGVLWTETLYAACEHHRHQL